MLTRWTLIVCLICLLVCLLMVGGAVASGMVSTSVELAYMSYTAINPDIYLTDLPHRITFNLTHSASYDAAPVWSPDGEYLAFVSDRTGRQTIYLIEHGQGQPHRLIDDNESYTTPRWTADGQKLVVLAPRQGANAFYVVNRDGTGLAAITENIDPGTGREIDIDAQTNDGWRKRSPDGSLFAFMTFRQQQWGIFVSSEANAADARFLASIGQYTSVFAWSPDSRQIAYPAYADGMVDLYTVPLDGGLPERLTFGRAIDTAPAWRP